MKKEVTYKEPPEYFNAEMRKALKDYERKQKEQQKEKKPKKK